MSLANPFKLQLATNNLTFHHVYMANAIMCG